MVNEVELLAVDLALCSESRRRLFIFAYSILIEYTYYKTKAVLSVQSNRWMMRQSLLNFPLCPSSLSSAPSLSPISYLFQSVPQTLQEKFPFASPSRGGNYGGPASLNIPRMAHPRRVVSISHQASLLRVHPKGNALYQNFPCRGESFLRPVCRFFFFVPMGH